MELRKIMPKKIVPSDKRGMGINDIYPIMLTICVTAILIAVIIFILVELQEQMAEDDLCYTQVNQSINITTAGVSVNGTACSPNGFVISELDVVPNGSNVAASQIATDFTLADNGVVYFTGTGLLYNGSEFNISYNMCYGGESCEATADIVEDIGDFVPWIGIILLVVAAAIVIGVLIRNLAGGSRV